MLTVCPCDPLSWSEETAGQRRIARYYGRLAQNVEGTLGRASLFPGASAARAASPGAVSAPSVPGRRRAHYRVTVQSEAGLLSLYRGRRRALPAEPRVTVRQETPGTLPAEPCTLAGRLSPATLPLAAGPAGGGDAHSQRPGWPSGGVLVLRADCAGPAAPQLLTRSASI
ncbi:MAG: hypothetical protein ACLU9S_09895 [Oscillospiraceae bacterium]